MKAILIASIAAQLAGTVLALDRDHAGALPSWDDAPEEFRAGAQAQVEAYLAAPELTPEAVYAAWLQAKHADGWAFGETFDADKKLSPSIVAWEDAPWHRRLLETMLHATARALKDTPDHAAQVGAGNVPLETVDKRVNAVLPSSVVVVDGHVAVKYVGPRESYKDGLFGTGMVFERGQTRMVPSAVALQMFRHPGVYVPGEVPQASQVVAQVPTGKVPQPPEEERLQEVRDSVNAMTEKAAVEAFVKQHFQIDIDKRKGLQALKEHALQLVDQYGIA